MRRHPHELRVFAGEGLGGEGKADGPAVQLGHDGVLGCQQPTGDGLRIVTPERLERGGIQPVDGGQIGRAGRPERGGRGGWRGGRLARRTRVIDHLVNLVEVRLGQRLADPAIRRDAGQSCHCFGLQRGQGRFQQQTRGAARALVGGDRQHGYVGPSFRWIARGRAQRKPQEPRGFVGFESQHAAAVAQQRQLLFHRQRAEPSPGVGKQRGQHGPIGRRCHPGGDRRSILHPAQPAHG